MPVVRRVAVPVAAARRLPSHVSPVARIGLIPNDSTLVPSTSQSSSGLQTIVNFAEHIVGGLFANDVRDQVRQERAKVISSLALAGSVLAAQICIAGPANVASNEDQYWQAAQQAVQQQRPDVWAAAQAAGPYWPVGQPFDMIPIRQEIGADLARQGIIVNQQALTTPFGSNCTDQGGSCGSLNKITVTVTYKGSTTQVVPDPVPGATGPIPPNTGPAVPTNPNLAGSSSSILMIALVGAVVYGIMSKKRGGSNG